MVWLLRILHAVTLLAIVGAAVMLFVEILQGAFMFTGPVWSLGLFWSALTLAGVQLCLLAVRAQRLVILMWASAPIAIFTVGLIGMLSMDTAFNAGSNSAMLSRWASTGFFVIWMLAAIGSLHRLVIFDRWLQILRGASDVLIVAAMLSLLALIWWWPLHEHVLQTPPHQIDRSLEDAGRLTAALAILATMCCVMLLVIAKRRELTGEADSVTTVRLDFTAICPRCGARSNLKTGGDVCAQCRLRITVKPA